MVQATYACVKARCGLLRGESLTDGEPFSTFRGSAPHVAIADVGWGCRNSGVVLSATSPDVLVLSGGTGDS